MAIESSRNPGAFREFEHDGWETVSVGYERHFARLTTQTVPAILDAAHVAEGMRVLDVCTGPGMLAGSAVKRGAQVVALDFSGKFIEIARRNVPGAVRDTKIYQYSAGGAASIFSVARVSRSPAQGILVAVQHSALKIMPPSVLPTC